MKKIFLALIILIATGAAIIYLFPEKTEPYVAGIPLEKLAGSSTPMYQWRDGSGKWQITDEPPPDGIPYEVKQYSLDANLLPSSGSDKE
jgi:hypothetical protein